MSVIGSQWNESNICKPIRANLFALRGEAAKEVIIMKIARVLAWCARITKDPTPWKTPPTHFLEWMSNPIKGHLIPLFATVPHCRTRQMWPWRERSEEPMRDDVISKIRFKVFLIEFLSSKLIIEISTFDSTLKVNFIEFQRLAELISNFNWSNSCNS